jgi:hypothetical protein
VPFPCEEIFGDGYGQRGSHFSGFHGQVRIAFSSSHIAVSGLGFGSEFEVQQELGNALFIFQFEV